MPVILKKALPVIKKLPSTLLSEWGLERMRLSEHSTLVTIQQEEVVDWLSKAHTTTKKNRRLIEDLRNALLKDVSSALNAQLKSSLPANVQPIKKANKFSRLKKAKFIMLAIAGGLLAFCEGYDGIATILSSIAGGVGGLSISLGLVCAVISVVVFSGFELNALSQNLGVNLKGIRYMLDTFEEQTDEISNIRIAVEELYVTIDDLGELMKLQQMVRMLLLREEALSQVKATYNKQLNNQALQIVKKGVALLTGALYFSGGFFAGQTLALAVVGLFISGASAMFWPVVLASVVVGIAGFALYWFLERPALENVVGRFLGLDKEKINALPDNKHKALNQLQGCISDKIKDKRQTQILSDLNADLHAENARLQAQLAKTPLIAPVQSIIDPSSPSINPAGFFTASAPAVMVIPSAPIPTAFAPSL